MASKVHSTTAQEAKAAELRELGITVYSDKRRGDNIIRTFERYLETGEPKRITGALREFLMSRCDFEAHFDIHNFRRFYVPVTMLDKLSLDRSMSDPKFADPQQEVYTDGMSSGEIKAEMRAVIGRLAASVYGRQAASKRDSDLRLARQLAKRHGFQLVPVTAKTAA